MQEGVISTDFLGFLRFGVQQELAMNYIYGLHTQRGVSIYKCQYCLDYKDIYNTFYKGDNFSRSKK